MNTKKDFQLTESEILKKYNIDEIEQGISDDQAKEKLKKDGLNKIESQRTPKWKLLLSQFNNLITYILIFAVLITLFLQHISDSIIIAIVVVVNVLIGYYQESNASDALEKIKDMLSTNATVYRDGIRHDIPAEEVVVGDVVFIEAGDNVPADLRLVEVDNLMIQESALTGESDSVEKITEEISDGSLSTGDQINSAFASTSVTGGSGIGIVTAIGSATEIGKISVDVGNTKSRKTPLMKELDGLGKGISYLIIGVSIALFIFGLYLQIYSLPVLALAIVTMIVGALPEGLPATTSVVLALGVSDMAKNKNIIVKTLPAVETLGSVDVIATDKTGTLTKNEMTVKNLILDDVSYEVSGSGYEPVGQIEGVDKSNENEHLKLFLDSGFQANDTILSYDDDRWEINGEPTDGAFLTLFYKYYDYPYESDYEEVDMLPFDSEYRYIAKLVQNTQGQKKLFIKGSPDKLFQMAKNSQDDSDVKYWNEKVTNMSSQGQRVVAVGYKEVDDSVNEITHEFLEDGISLLGLAGIIDPPREEVIDSLKVMNEAGVSVKMITGDHPKTAKAIGEKLGLAKNINVITGAELDAMSDEEFKKAVVENQVFARTTPTNKMDIVKFLQENEKVTAMTGDGVNDAPALKRADIGVAMGIEGTDVAKDSADMILTDDNFTTMSSAIKEGRRIYDNIKKSILFLLPTSFAEGLIIVFTILSQQKMPLQPSQLLWINMVSAITIQFAFIFEPAEKGIMKRKPRKSGKSLLNKHDVFQMIYVAVLISLIGLFAYDWLMKQGVGQTVASTMMVNIVILGKIFYLFNIRTNDYALSNEFFSNKKAFIIIGLMMLLQFALTYLPFMQSVFKTGPMSMIEWMISIGAGVIILVVTEFDKFIRKTIKKK